MLDGVEMYNSGIGDLRSAICDLDSAGGSEQGRGGEESVALSLSKIGLLGFD